MDDVLALPTGPLTEASLALVRSTESQPIVDHSIRTFLFARLLADHEGCLNDAAYDEELLFAATVMHDLGLGKQAREEKGSNAVVHDRLALRRSDQREARHGQGPRGEREDVVHARNVAPRPLGQQWPGGH